MSKRPESAVRARVGASGVAGALLGFSVALWLGSGAITLLVALIAGAGLPMWWLEYRSVGGRRLSASAFEALTGTALACVLVVGSILVQLNWGGMKGAVVAVLLLPALLLSAFVVLCSLVRPTLIGESIVLSGRCIRKWIGLQPADQDERTALQGWLVKATFLPLMLGSSLVWLDGVDRQALEVDWLSWFTVPFFFMYAIDTAFGAIGYMSASKRIDAHIRSVDSTWLGWLSALVCYPPLSVFTLDVFLVCRHGGDWMEWLQAGSPESFVWGGVILFLTAIYTWSTVVFGPRFSNLTNRGVVTSGPYRWAKHPAYFAKNLSWWFISVPFLPVMGWRHAAFSCGALFCVNAIYYVRAMTEERHLMRDEAYVHYADWIQQHGLVARLLSKVAILRNRAM